MKEAPARGGRGRKREPSSSPDRGPPKQNRRKLLAARYVQQFLHAQLGLSRGNDWPGQLAVLTKTFV